MKYEFFYGGRSRKEKEIIVTTEGYTITADSFEEAREKVRKIELPLLKYKDEYLIWGKTKITQLGNA